MGSGIGVPAFSPSATASPCHLPLQREAKKAPSDEGAVSFADWGRETGTDWVENGFQNSFKLRREGGAVFFAADHGELAAELLGDGLGNGKAQTAATGGSRFITPGETLHYLLR